MGKTINKTLLVIAAGVLLLGVWGTKHKAQAETVEATRDTRVMSRPGEKSRVVTRVDTGASLKVLAKKGRWYKVKANGRTGWVKRTSVASTRAARKGVRNTRRKAFVEGRSKRRGWSGSAPDDKVGADVVEEEELIEDELEDDEVEVAARSGRSDRRDADDLDEPVERFVIVAADTDLMAKPSSSSDALIAVEPGSELLVIRESRSGDWLLVENIDGDAGWIRSGDIKDDAGGQYRYAKTTRAGGARIGYATIGSTFASDGMGELANYSTAAAAATLSVSGSYIHKYSEQYLLRGDVGYTGMRSSPGIRYTNAAGQAGDIAFTQHEVDLGAAVGYNLKWDNGAVVYGRVGYHYGKFEVHEVDNFDVNLALLPSEILSGITVGVHVDVPRVNEKYAAHVGIDAIYPNGELKQTVGLEDGALADVFAAWATATVIYQWKPDMTLQGMYRYGMHEILWTGQAEGSMRPHNATEAARKDISHSLYVGVGKEF